jgi:hypothetical protein
MTFIAYGLAIGMIAATLCLKWGLFNCMFCTTFWLSFCIVPMVGLKFLPAWGIAAITAGIIKKLYD